MPQSVRKRAQTPTRPHVPAWDLQAAIQSVFLVFVIVPLKQQRAANPLIQNFVTTSSLMRAYSPLSLVISPFRVSLLNLTFISPCHAERQNAHTLHCIPGNTASSETWEEISNKASGSAHWRRRPLTSE